MEEVMELSLRLDRLCWNMEDAFAALADMAALTSSPNSCQPDAVCEVGGSTPDLSYGNLEIFLGGGQQRNLHTS